jgi:hypothetical protein
MMYLAAILMLVGVLLLVLAALGPRETGIRRRRPNSGQFNPSYRKPSPLKSPTTSSYTKYPNHVDSEEEERRIRIERSLHPESPRQVYQEPIVLEEEPILTSANSLEREPNVIISDEQEPKRFFEIEGYLFMDLARKITFDDRKIKDTDWKEDVFTSFKRVGQIKLLEQEGIFLLTGKNFTHTYRVKDIDQIIFYPTESTTPASLILTPDTYRYKEELIRRK